MHTVCANVEGPKIFWHVEPRNLTIGEWLTPRNTPLPTNVTTANVVVPGQSVALNCGYPPEKFDASRPAFQGHSRSLEPTRINRQPMTSC